MRHIKSHSSLRKQSDAIRSGTLNRCFASRAYPLEARAMADTWSDSWFEQGARSRQLVEQLSERGSLRNAECAVARGFEQGQQVGDAEELENLWAQVDELEPAAGRFR